MDLIDGIINMFYSSDEESLAQPRYDKTQFDPPVSEKLPEIYEADKKSLDDGVNNTEFVKVDMEKKQPEEENQLLEYKVEDILDMRKRRGVIEYLIKWKEYSEDHNSWEPENMLSCNDLLAEFKTTWYYESKEYLSKFD